MNFDDFDKSLQSMASAFGISLKAERIMAYYDVFNNISEQSWKEICERAKLNQERFPTIKELSHLAYELGAFGKKQREGEWRLFACECGELMAFNRKKAVQDSSQWADCPKKFYGTCNKSYQAGFMLRNMEAM